MPRQKQCLPRALISHVDIVCTGFHAACHYSASRSYHISRAMQEHAPLSLARPPWCIEGTLGPRFASLRSHVHAGHARATLGLRPRNSLIFALTSRLSLVRISSSFRLRHRPSSLQNACALPTIRHFMPVELLRLPITCHHAPSQSAMSHHAPSRYASSKLLYCACSSKPHAPPRHRHAQALNGHARVLRQPAPRCSPRLTCRDSCPRPNCPVSVWLCVGVKRVCACAIVCIWCR